ncbi:spore coat putative kinase YutH [Bacillus massiliigorillae]|uniref:spore coat putative kinase YutH n=1 Tax=Bacillus massiliigorillae TaxID=1243664 RepID=UPI0003A1EA64|nr:spore coat protein YutH [Bacillus massiliigorillae]
MLEDVIYENYGLTMERQRMEGAYQRFFSGHALFTIVPIAEVNEDELMERLKMSHFMQQQGDQYVSSFVMSRENTYLSQNEGNLFILMENTLLEEPRPIKMGSKLSKFHSRGRTFAEPIKVCNRIGKWKELWENRIDTLEAVWREKLQAHPINDFEKLFVESFPYYVGLGENAIQYLVDCEIDENPTNLDAGTVCHERFYNDMWNGEYLLKNPFDWVFDHQSRDIGEWIRQHYHRLPQTFQPTMVQFMNEYQSNLPLSGFSWRLLYARLLFPVHYLEAVESYFSSRKMGDQRKLEENLEEMLEQSHHHEEFLRYFYEVNEVPIQNLRIPKVDWL